jgi:hypothetical protein
MNKLIISDEHVPTEDEEDEYLEIERRFPNAGFSICFSLKDLDEILSNEPIIIIKNTFKCYCYSEFPKDSEYYIIKGGKLTYSFIIKELIRQGLYLECNHRFLEGFWKTPTSDVQYVLMTGS